MVGCGMLAAMTSNTTSSHLSDQVVVVTGAGSGIGRCYAIRLARLGYNIVLVGNVDEPLQSVKKIAASGKMSCLFNGLTCDSDGLIGCHCVCKIDFIGVSDQRSTPTLCANSANLLFDVLII